MSSTVHDPHQIAEPHVTEVSEGIFAYIQPDGGWWINNTGFLTGRRGVVSINSCATELRTRRYIDAITRVSAQPVRTVINTHHHGDHTNGNYLFDTATVVGHERSRDAVLATGLPNYRGVWNDIAWGDLELSPPFLTYSDRITVWADEVRCEVSHVGIPAHTTNNSIIWIPERSVLFSGDLLFNGGTPFLLMGSIAGAITAVSNLLDLGAATIVPGHGEVTELPPNGRAELRRVGLPDDPAHVHRLIRARGGQGRLGGRRRGPRSTVAPAGSSRHCELSSTR